MAKLKIVKVGRSWVVRNVYGPGEFTSYGSYTSKAAAQEKLASMRKGMATARLKNPASAIPKGWTTAKVRRLGNGSVQVKI